MTKSSSNATWIEEEELEQEDPLDPNVWTKWVLVIPNKCCWLERCCSLKDGIIYVGVFHLVSSVFCLTYYVWLTVSVWLQCWDDSITIAVLAGLRSLTHAGIAYFACTGVLMGNGQLRNREDGHRKTDFRTTRPKESATKAYRRIRKGLLLHVPLVVSCFCTSFAVATLWGSRCSITVGPVRNHAAAWAALAIAESLASIYVYTLTAFLLYSYFWRLKYFPASLHRDPEDAYRWLTSKYLPKP